MGIPLEFLVFGLTLVGIAIFDKKAMIVALTGLAITLILKYLFQHGFSFSEHVLGSDLQEGEWRILLNLLGLLTGFAILAKLFKDSGIVDSIPAILPNNWMGGVLLLAMIMALSSVLDNIAASVIGSTIALVVFNGRVHIGYIAAIVAASNAGGAGSVIGDTTTTLMWIDGVSPVQVLHAFIASIAAFLVFGLIAARQQHKYQPIQKDPVNHNIDYYRLSIVILILIGAILTNWTLDFPAVGVWIAILIGSLIRKVPWSEIPKSIPGTIFLMSLITLASLMPVNHLPEPSWKSTFILGFVSSVFDNIPLTKLCIEQGGYDWGILAYAVGFGGSMIWFGSSAGVAISNMLPEAKSVIKYVRHGWHVIVAYIAGFFVLLWLLGWHPQTYGKLEKSIKKHLKKNIQIESMALAEFTAEQALLITG
jgi:Na+/H+ antiporter NhaD/arsenite permease-like protein